MQHTSTPSDIKISLLLVSAFALPFTLQRTSSGEWTYSSSLSLLHPGHPAAPGFKRSRAASWCLFELCVKYRYRKSPQGQTHKALTVSYWVLVPITHLHGLFSCQLPRCNSQLHDFKKSLSGAGVDWQPKLPLWLRLSAKHTRRSVPLKTVVKKELNNSGNDIKAPDASVTIESAWVWPEFAEAGHACVKHALPSIGAASLSKFCLPEHQEDIF